MFGDWLDARLGHRRFLRAICDQPVAGGARWAYVFGSLLTLCLVTELVTGWLLMSAYAPSATTAWASVHHITFVMRTGWILRGLHHFGAQAIVVLLVAHLAQAALFGAYRRPRELTWYLGLALLALTMLSAHTGYLLPWDQRGFWATRVAANIMGTLPVVGGFVQDQMLGGPEFGHMTLARFYTLHVSVLPAAIALLLVLHVVAFRKHGYTRPEAGHEAAALPARADRYFPRQALRVLAAGFVVLLVLFALTARMRGAPLDAPADAASDYPARPEWYMRPLFELRKMFHGPMELVAVPGVPMLLGAYLVLLPFIDRGRSRAARIVALSPLALVGCGAMGLSLKSFRDDQNDAAYQASTRVAEQRAARAIELAKNGVPVEGPLAMLRSDPETRGAELFERNCASCHRLNELGPPAGKDTAPDLTGWLTKEWILALLDDPDSTKLFGLTPFKGQMPSFTKPPADPEAAKLFTAMTGAEQDAVATFLLAQAKGERAEGTPGEKLVKTRCTSCHRFDGKAPDDEDALGPELRGWGSVAWTAAQIDDPASGKAYPPGARAPELKGHMPAFADKLGDKDRKLLAAWVVAKASR